MKQIAKITAALMVLLAVSACSTTGSEEVFSSYDYNAVSSVASIIDAH